MIKLPKGVFLMTFKDTFKKLRLDANLSQSQLSEELGLSLNTIRSYEAGRRQPNSKAMVLLEQYFNVSGAYLRGETDQLNIDECDNDHIHNDLVLAANTLISSACNGSDNIPSVVLQILVELRNLINAEQKITSDQYSEFVSKIILESTHLARNLMDHASNSDKCERDCAEFSYRMMNTIIEFQKELLNKK